MIRKRPVLFAVLAVVVAGLIVYADKHLTADHAMGCEYSAEWIHDFWRLDAEITIIAHAGGGTPWGGYANTLDAMSWHYDQGIRVFEVDFSFTRDGELVGLHGWDTSFRHWFERSSLPVMYRAVPWLAGWRPLSHSEFMAARMRCNLQQLDLQQLRRWLAERPDAVIVTDVKGDNFSGLAAIAREMGPQTARFVAQVHNTGAAAPARSLGFGRVALTDYVERLDPRQLVAKARDGEFDVVVVHWSRVRDPEFSWSLDELASMDVELWVYVVNTRPLTGDVVAAGFDAIMTDRWIPSPRHP